MTRFIYMRPGSQVREICRNLHRQLNKIKK